MADTGGSPEISAIPDDVAALGKYASDLAETLRSALTGAGREVEALTSSGWTGTASASFASGWAECQDGGSTIIDALSTMASSLGVTADSYRSHDNQFAAEISSLDLP
ncbi:WXG100 family type VII secretion target [Nocardia sp. NEAU-G5]|uniref:WXG100 family type VII secretion target n=1 Tax=Nocardia albiluteola TaxID=2842303 RepID=A0ABS6AV58_9NOCA|nr:WXG100 family type VII secretion target [Nocardia albiluteola]MBU3060928.1 WXG100 family type VII secretion target [Nocardia albiluteola]